MAMLHPVPHPRRAGPPLRTTVGLLVAAAFHAGLFAWLMHQSFTPRVEPIVDPGGVILISPPPPPPEPPRVQPQTPRESTLAPHKVQSTFPAPQTLDVPPVEHLQPSIEAPPIAGVEPPTITEPAVVTAKPTPPAPVVRAPALLRRPSASDLARFYPERALRLEREGRTDVACTVGVSGVAEACRLVSETPADLGFGKAALALAKTFRFTPKTVDGKAVAGGEVRLPLRWTLEAAQ